MTLVHTSFTIAELKPNNYLFGGWEISQEDITLEKSLTMLSGESFSQTSVWLDLSIICSVARFWLLCQ